MPVSRTYGAKFILLCHGLISMYHYSDAEANYANVTLRSPKGDLSSVIFLPEGIKADEPTFYLASRFDHSSMIGNIRRTTHNPETGKKTTHLLYGSEQWRVPHDPHWPESGVGLAAEFGVGDDGAFCSYRCGWYEVNDVTNGVLGYQEAKNGDSFLKIGVGELIKGSCPICDSSEDYKFNSPYEFKKRPEWTRETSASKQNFLALGHEATLEQYGYKIRKEITLNDSDLLVKTVLSNTGRVPFATAWYSHHFYTCDNHPIGRGVGVEIDLASTGGDYDEPGTWFWSTPIENYASINAWQEAVAVEMTRGVEQNVRIKAEFTKDTETLGHFAIHGCETLVKETIPEIADPRSDVSMYAFNLYIESGTFSPEPQIYVHLWPGQTTSWTQRLEFEDFDESLAASSIMEFTKAEMASGQSGIMRKLDRSFIVFALTVACLALFLQSVLKRRGTGSNHAGYSSIPEVVSTDPELSIE